MAIIILYTPLRKCRKHLLTIRWISEFLKIERIIPVLTQNLKCLLVMLPIFHLGFIFIFTRLQTSSNIHAMSRELRIHWLYPILEKYDSLFIKRRRFGCKTKLHLRLRLKLWRSGKRGVLLHCHPRFALTRNERNFLAHIFHQINACKKYGYSIGQCGRHLLKIKTKLRILINLNHYHVCESDILSTGNKISLDAMTCRLEIFRKIFFFWTTSHAHTHVCLCVWFTKNSLYIWYRILYSSEGDTRWVMVTWENTRGSKFPPGRGPFLSYRAYVPRKIYGSNFNNQIIVQIGCFNIGMATGLIKIYQTPLKFELDSHPTQGRWVG